MNDFSAILTAVKPKERTAQYVVLAALASLQAHKTPVTARAVSDLLKLHLGSESPSNVNGSLRKYTAFVQATAGGPPIKWLLTDKGLNHLITVSGLRLSESATIAYGYDIGLVCALEEPEFSAAVNCLGGEKKWREIGNPSFTHVYRESEMTTNAGEVLKVVGCTSTSMGLTAAAITTTQLILQFRPRIVVMVGIAAGTRDGAKQFGDVLVADPSVDYNSGKVVQKNGIRDFLPDPYPIGLNARLRSVLQRYKGNHPLFDEIRSEWKGELPPGSNRMHLGPLGAADQVIDDEQRIYEIQRNWRKLIGIEMETYGVYRACHEAPEPKPRFISAKAVCDFAANKGDSWQAYAAFVSARFAFGFLRREWSAIWPTVIR